MNAIYFRRLLLVLVNVFLFAVSPAYADMVPSSSNADWSGPGALGENQPESSIFEISASVVPYDSSSSPFSVSSGDFVNCVLFDVRISGRSYLLLLPADHESDVMVDSDGYLWNMSTSQVTGRLFTDTFDPLADEGKILYLAPCTGNNFQVNHEYGSPNYVRDYYWTRSSGYDRLTYDTEYVTVEVLKSHHLFNTGDLLSYFLVFLVGCCLICLWKRR